MGSMRRGDRARHRQPAEHDPPRAAPYDHHTDPIGRRRALTTKPYHMTPEELKAAIVRLGYPYDPQYKAFAGHIGVNDRTVRRWTLGEQHPPLWLSVLIRLMLDRLPP